MHTDQANSEYFYSSCDLSASMISSSWFIFSGEVEQADIKQVSVQKGEVT